MRIDLPDDIFTYPDVPLPEVWTVEQRSATASLAPDEIVARAESALDELARDPRLRPGASVAIGAGSRGITDIVPIVRTVVRRLQAREMAPFIVPAMGSHGGATADGQRAILLGYGLTREATGCDIRAAMDVDEIGRLPAGTPFTGFPVYCDRIAHDADAIVLVNRVKPHTDFRGEIESGIAKMAAIGLGKQKGAGAVHRHGAYGLRELMPRVARFVAENTALIGGIAVLENQRGETAEVHAVPAADIAGERERMLLRRARALSPAIPFHDLDVLVIDEIGKNISGTGMDTNVIGRGLMPSIPEQEWGGPSIRIVVAMDLTEASHGNAAGIGLADIITQDLLCKVDFAATFTNMRTSGEGGVLKCRLPLTLPSAEDCVRTAVATCGVATDAIRLARIRNTAHTECLEISAALVDAARANSALAVAPASHALDLRHRLSV